MLVTSQLVLVLVLVTSQLVLAVVLVLVVLVTSQLVLVLASFGGSVGTGASCA